MVDTVNKVIVRQHQSKSEKLEKEKECKHTVDSRESEREDFELSAIESTAATPSNKFRIDF